jgi:hypothetical protein
MGAKISTPFRSVRFGSYLGKSVNVVYQALTDGIVLIQGIAGIHLIVDDVTPPVARTFTQNPANAASSPVVLAVPILKNQYYQAGVDSGGTVQEIRFLPLENIWGLA